MIDATPMLRAVAARRLAVLARQDPATAQRRTLAALLRRAAGTRFGRDHGFGGIRSVADYQAAVPLRRYEDFAAYWPGPVLRNATWPGLIPYLAQSSGTTGGSTKRIPVSRAMVRANSAAAFDTLAWHLRARPESRVGHGMNILLGGSAALIRAAPGVHAGDLSGIAAQEMPIWTRGRSFPPRELALIGDWEAKMAAMAPRSLSLDVRSISGTPSWMLLFFEQAAAASGRARRLCALYPGLDLIVHGGVGFAPYAASMAEWLEGSRAETREVYAASEGYIATADRGPGEGLRLILDRGLFYEFVRPAELESPRPDRRWIGTAEPGVDYALVISSNAGLWSYVIGDTVRLVETFPPRVLITGRTAFTLNLVGEHLIVEELDQAAAAAARATGAALADYTVAPVPPRPDEPRAGHHFVLELSPARPGAEALAAGAIDATLRELNEDYAAHRGGDFGMLPPAVTFAPPGTFAAWMAGRGKLGGQNKVPRVLSDAALLQGLLSLCAQTASSSPRGGGTR